MTTKPPLPPEAHRRPLSPPLVRRPQPEVREGRRLTRQCSDQPQHTRHQSPPAWFHPVKSVSPPASILKPASSSASLTKPPPPPRSPVTRLTCADVRPVSPPPVATRATPPPPIIQKPCVPPPPVPVQQPCPVIRSEPHPSSSQQDDDEDSDTVIDLDSLIRQKCSCLICYQSECIMRRLHFSEPHCCNDPDNHLGDVSGFGDNLSPRGQCL